MKIKSSFVTNSSSTNFIIVSNKKPNKKDLFELLGFKTESPFTPHIGDLIYGIISDIKPSEEFFREYYHSGKYKSFEEFVKVHFGETTLARIIDAKKKGKNVLCGTFRSEESKFLSFFCCDSILIEDKNILFDATECTW